MNIATDRGPTVPAGRPAQWNTAIPRRPASRIACLTLAATPLIALIVQLSTPSDASAGAALPERSIQVPFPATLDLVIERGAIDGHPVSITRFMSRMAVGDALRATVRAWERGGAAPVVSTVSAGWQILSTRDEGRYRTLQIRATAAGGSEGLLSVWSTEVGPAASGIEIESLLPPVAMKLRRVEGVDSGRRHQTIVAVIDASPDWSAAAIESRAVAVGFARDPVEGSSAKPSFGGARHYRGNGRELALTLHSHYGRTAVVVHMVEAVQ